MNRVSGIAIQVYVTAIRQSLSEELRLKPWKNDENEMAGHCYVASEAFYHLIGGKSCGWKPMFTRHYDVPHWFVQHEDGEIVDITADQFEESVEYHVARGKGFLTKQPSKRAQIVIDRVDDLMREAAQCVKSWSVT